MLERIDHIVAVTGNLAAAVEPHEKLGLVFTPEGRNDQTGISNRACFVGTSPANYTFFEFVTVNDEAKARASGRSVYIDVIGAGGGVAGLVFGVGEVAASAAKLSSAGYATPVETVRRPDGSPVLDTATVDTKGAVPFRTSICQYPESWDARFERSREAGRFAHSFPLKRLDHLAAFAPDLEAATRFWGEALGVPVSGEIKTPAMTIRQLKIGDAVFELLGPAGADSPLAKRPAGIASMCAWEVEGRLEDAVALARERGFTCEDPADGVIPGTRRASIPAGELGGLGMQLLEYV
jgi:catechol 2,3-dioxygenase-like lactoylglutathione lyase family enzyme